MTVCGLLIGIIIIIIVLFDVFQSVVVPRWTPRTLRIASLLVRTTWPMWRRSTIRLRSLKHREYFLGIFAPLSLIVSLLVWVVALIFGYGLVLYALRFDIRPEIDDFGSALYLAGTSLLTLGFGDLVAISTARIVVLVAAVSGLAVTSLTIALLFSLYNSLLRREVLVDLLEARAGTPPSGVKLLETYAQLNILDQLPIAFSAWEVWSAEVFESHRAYAILPFFRSTLENNSWISALGAMLDACTLLLTTVESDDYGAARLLYSIGCRVVLDLNRLFDLCASESVGVEREQFEQALACLARAGFQMRDSESAWHSFAQMRSAYGGALNALVKYFATPSTQWIGHHATMPYPHYSRRPQSTTQRHTSERED